MWEIFIKRYGFFFLVKDSCVNETSMWRKIILQIGSHQTVRFDTKVPAAKRIRDFYGVLYHARDNDPHKPLALKFHRLFPQVICTYVKAKDRINILYIVDTKFFYGTTTWSTDVVLSSVPRHKKLYFFHRYCLEDTTPPNVWKGFLKLGQLYLKGFAMNRFSRKKLISMLLRILATHNRSHFRPLPTTSIAFWRNAILASLSFEEKRR